MLRFILMIALVTSLGTQMTPLLSIATPLSGTPAFDPYTLDANFGDHGLAACFRIDNKPAIQAGVAARRVDNFQDLSSTPRSMSDLPPQVPAHKAGFILAEVPHAAALKLTIIDVKPGETICKVPYAEHLIGNPDTGVVHGGVITSLLDNACGIAVGSKTALQGQIATLDLRIDYMKPATPGEDIFAFAECFKVTKNIAFVRGVAYHADRADPIATCAAAFMLGTRSAKGGNRTPGGVG